MAAPPKVHIMLFHTLCSASLCVVFVRLGLKAELWPWLLPPRYTSCCFTSFVLHVFVCGVCRTPGTHHAVSLFDSCVFVWCLSDSVLSSRKAALGAWLLPVRYTSCGFTLSPLHLFVCGVVRLGLVHHGCGCSFQHMILSRNSIFCLYVGTTLRWSRWCHQDYFCLRGMYYHWKYKEGYDGELSMTKT